MSEDNNEPTDKDSNEPSEEEQRAYEWGEWLEHGGPFGRPVFPNIDDKSKSKSESTTKIYSVLEAKRIHNGPISVIGKIVTKSEMYVLEASNGPDTIYRDARFIQLEDVEKLDENERLDVTLYDDNIQNVVAGEIVEIEGMNRIQDFNNKSKKKIVVLHAESIKYVNKKEFVITPEHIESFKKFANLDCEFENCPRNLLRRLIAMIAPNVIGHDDVKLGLLRSIVGGDNHDEFKDGFIDTFMVGDQGTAKSTLAAEAAKIKPNSRHVSAPHASAKTITGIVDKENEGYTLRLGAIPLAKNAICGIDEITAWPPEDQGKLLDVLQDREFDLDKHGRHFEIPAPTTIIATANPAQSRWSDRDRISNDEVPIIKKLLDRFKQIYAFKDDMSDKQTHEFTKQMSAIRKRKPHNYNFLTGYLMHASSIKIVKVTPEAEFMLNDFWEKAKAKGKLSFRMYKGLFNIAEAMTKLHLKEIVDSKFAEQAIEAVRLMMVQYGETVKSTTNPRELTLNKCLEILREVKAGITVYSLFEMACKSDKVISEYIGRNWSMDSNHKVKNVVDLLRNHSNIKPVGVNPVILQWSDSAQSSSQPDQPDAPDAIIENNDNENTVKADTSKIKIASDRSDRSDSNPKTPELIPMGKTKLQPCYSEGSYPIRTENPLECPDCHRMIDPFDKNTHPACCKG